MKKLALLMIAAGTFACANDNVEKPAEGAKSGAQKTAAKLSPSAELALQPIGGTTPVDQKIAELQASAKRQPDKADLWILLGQAFVRKARQSSDPGFYLNANACADVALEKKADYPLALSLRGLVLLNDHRFAQARDLANATLEKDPENLIALGVLSDALLELGEVEASVVATDKMMSLKPNLPAYSRAAHLRWLHGDLAGAKSTYRLAIDAGLGARDGEPSAWVLSEAAKMFFLAGDYAGAEVGYDRALSVVPDYPHAMIGKARAAIALGRYDEAAQLAKRAYELSSLSDAAWVWGDAARAAGRGAEAESAYAELVRTGQHDKSILAAFYATEGREVDAAVRFAEEELKTRGDLGTHDAYAWALYRAKRIPEAKAAIARATRLGTKDPTLTYHAGAIAIAAGDVAGGKKLLKQALEMSPKFHPTGAREAEELLRAK